MKYKAPTFLYSIIIPYSVVWQMCDNMTHKHIKILWRKCDYRKGTVTMRRLLLLWFLWYSCFAPKQERTFFFVPQAQYIGQLVSWSLACCLSAMFMTLLYHNIVNFVSLLLLLFLERIVCAFMWLARVFPKTRHVWLSILYSSCSDRSCLRYWVTRIRISTWNTFVS